MSSQLDKRTTLLRGMKILHYTAYDNLPGAAKSAYNIHRTFVDNGADSAMVVLKKGSNDSSVFQAIKGNVYYFRRFIEILKNRIKLNSKGKSLGNYNKKNNVKIGSLLPYKSGEVDVIFIYWIANYLSTELLEKIFNYYDCPIVWVLMDMEPITGGCHQSLDCTRYSTDCGCCKLIDSNNKNDATSKILRKKILLNANRDVTYIAPTNGALAQVKRSSVARNCRIIHIPLAIETDIYRNVSILSARDVLGISRNKVVVCFGANDIQSIFKGTIYLEEALQILAQRLIDLKREAEINNIVLLLAGGNRGNAFDKCPFEVFYLGHLKDIRSMALMFQASDLFVCPSVYDTGPVMIPEAMMCGTPVVAFDAGGATDLIESGQNGYIAKYKDSKDLARGIIHVIDGITSNNMREKARIAAINNNTQRHIAEEYLNLLTVIIDAK